MNQTTVNNDIIQYLLTSKVIRFTFGAMVGTYFAYLHIALWICLLVGFSLEHIIGNIAKIRANKLESTAVGNRKIHGFLS